MHCSESKAERSDTFSDYKEWINAELEKRRGHERVFLTHSPVAWARAAAHKSGADASVLYAKYIWGLCIFNEHDIKNFWCFVAKAWINSYKSYIISVSFEIKMAGAVKSGELSYDDI